MTWPEDEQDKVLAFEAEEAERCDGCGYPIAETTHPDSEGAYTATSVRCFACEARALEAKRFAGPDNSTAGLLIAVTRRDDG